jgi:CPA1 family monovalent cation:H+ antiporter
MLHTVFIVIALLIAIIVSNVINKVFPKIPLPLIQVVFGFIFAFFGADDTLRLEPEVFLAFIIGPLLFREGEESDVKSILKHWKTVLLLVFPVVFITALTIGGVAHSFYPAVPLTACIAIGASLGPTDVVAMSSVASRFDVPKRIMAVLKGEGLLNDASGLIAFQFAILKLTTGEFSLTNASLSLVLSIIEGVAIGFGVAILVRLILSLLEDVAAQDVTGYLLIELLMPLTAFMLAEEVHASGIIAVVVAGIMQANGLRKGTLFDARVDKLTNNIWHTIVFVFNAIVFLFLGMELEQIALPILSDSVHHNGKIILLVITLTAVLFLTRYIILGIYYRIVSFRRHLPFRRYLQDMAILTFSGVKGTVSIATILLLPVAVAKQYPLMVFTTAAVTMLSFLVGIVMLPIVTPKAETAINNMGRISVLGEVINELEKELPTANPRKRAALFATIDAYHSRIQTLVVAQEEASTSNDYNDLQLLILRLETEGLEYALAKGQITMKTYRIYQQYIKELEKGIVHKFVSSLALITAIIIRAFKLLMSNILHIDINFNSRKKLIGNSKEEIKALYLKNTEMILETLESLEGIYKTELIDFLQTNRLRTAELVVSGDYINRMINKIKRTNLDEMMRGYYLERKIIFEHEAAGLISSKEARSMRQNVNALEDFSMTSPQSSFLYELLQ